LNDRLAGAVSEGKAATDSGRFRSPRWWKSGKSEPACTAVRVGDDSEPEKRGPTNAADEPLTAKQGLRPHRQDDWSGEESVPGAAETGARQRH
jgi:hypothetical protein